MKKGEKRLNRVHLVGIYGSGKSTLAKKLSKILKIEPIDLDEIKYKRKYDIIRPLGDRLKIVKKISVQKKWITEGAWLDYAKPLYQKADLVVFLNVPKYKIYSRILIRHFKRKFETERYESHNLKTTLSIMGKVKQYFHDPNHFMTLDSHKEYIKKNAKKFIFLNNDKEIKHFLNSCLKQEN